MNKPTDTLTNNGACYNDNSLPESLAAEVVELAELTEDEQSDRYHLERKVERAFYEAGKALMELRDRRLYRSTHKTFEEYSRDRFSYNRSRSYQLIDAAGVVDNLHLCPQIVDILPTKEGQVRSLTQLDPNQQCEVWQQAVAEAGGKVPSGRIVKDIVQRIRERTKVPNPYRVAEVCQIVVKDNPDLRGKGGCWCIVTHLGDYSCTVTAWDGLYTLKLEHLKSLDYSDMECEQMNLVCDRLTKLRNSGKLEEAATSLLQHIGQIKRPSLTPLEEELLGVLETVYEVEAG
ncbi:MAG: hypothetical protein ACR2LR_25825 [Hassallia sp.]